MAIQKRILNNLLPGLLPLFVFVFADELWGMNIALVVATGFSMVELFFTYFKTGRFEKFILLDVSLIVMLGGISLVFDNEVFFKLKPAIVELILASMIGFSVFGGKNILLEISGRYLKGVKITKSARVRMESAMKVMFFLIIVHAALVVWAVFFMSKEAWAFISGVLFYLLIAAYFLFELFRNYLYRRKYGESEVLPEVDEEGRVIGRAPRSQFHFNPSRKMLHPVVHLHVFNGRGELFLQYRPAFKEVQPDKWDTAVGGHVSYGETIEEALIRESVEEIGMKPGNPFFLRKYVWETDVERELVFVFIMITPREPQINTEEVEKGKFWTLSEIREKGSDKIFTPNFLHEFQFLLEDQVFDRLINSSPH